MVQLRSQLMERQEAEHRIGDRLAVLIKGLVALALQRHQADSLVLHNELCQEGPLRVRALVVVCNPNRERTRR